VCTWGLKEARYLHAGMLAPSEPQSPRFNSCKAVNSPRYGSNGIPQRQSSEPNFKHGPRRPAELNETSSSRRIMESTPFCVLCTAESSVRAESEYVFQVSHMLHVRAERGNVQGNTVGGKATARARYCALLVSPRSEAEKL
jgi:hypothetical protein